MRQAARAVARVILAGALLALLPLDAHAQDAVIRIEARRGAESAAQGATEWAQEFPDVVTFPLAQGWVGIALGPQSPSEAAARLARLKQERRIPQDSFVAVPEGVALTAQSAGEAESQPQSQPVQGDAGGPSLAADAVRAGSGSLLDDGGIHIDMDGFADLETSQPPAPEPSLLPGHHIRLQTLTGLTAADEALTRWRADFPAAALWQLGDDRFAVALGPLQPDTAAAWLEALRDGGAVPGDVFTSTTAELGELVDEGATLDLPAPGPAQPLPPLDRLQRALQWAGHYQGPLDGQDGPGLQAAIAAEIAASRQSLDPGTAMQALVQRHEEWQARMGLQQLHDDHTGLSLVAPMALLDFNRNERQLSIYGPREGSGPALILFSQPGGQQELLDISGMVVALGWVPQPERSIEPDHVRLQGGNEHHLGHAEGWVREGQVLGFVLIWPQEESADHARIIAEIQASLTGSGAE